MAGRKQKCPDCSTKLIKSEDFPGRYCPSCFLVVHDTGEISRNNDPMNWEDEQQVVNEPLTTELPPGKYDLNHVSKGIQSFPSIDIYAWPIGIRGYRFGTKSPYPGNSLKKNMSGLEAYQFLRHIKRSNKKRVLEAKKLPDNIDFR